MSAPPATLVDVLRRHAVEMPDRRLYTYLADGDSEAGALTYGELDEAARAVAVRLLQIAQPGDRAMLLYPVGLEYLVGFFGCLYAGIIAVPAYPLRVESRSGGRIRTMIEDCRPALVLTCARLAEGVERAVRALDGGAGIRVVAPDQDLSIDEGQSFAPTVSREAIAFLQYTSASVGEAKGVRVTHANLMANQEMIRQAMGHDATSHFVSWLPPYHDMGLVGNLLQPLYLGSSCAFMPPAAFVHKPMRWLAAIGKYQAWTSGAPTFAYDMCVKTIEPDRDAPVDLSGWTVAYCGAEVVDARVFAEFCEHFRPWGFRKEAFYPCYGLAEATLMVSGSTPLEEAEVVEIDPDLLERGVFQACAPGMGRRLVTCGRPTTGSEIAIVDPIRRERLADGAIGEIWTAGAHVADGYWKRPDVSRDVFACRLEGSDARYLRTGDLGALQDGKLYVTGRIKEVIIHQGRNLYPLDIERIVEASAGGVIEACVAFALPADGTEAVAIVVETGRREIDSATAQRLGEAIAWDVYRGVEVLPARIAFGRKGTIPRTSSGKKQRLLCARLLKDGALAVDAEWSAAGLLVDVPADTEADGVWLAGAIGAFTGLTTEQIADRPASAWGLDSMRAIEIAHRIERRTGVPFPLRLFYESASFDAIVAEIQRCRSDARHLEYRTSPPEEPSASEAQPTRGQEAIWFAQQLCPDRPAYQINWAVRIAGSLDGDRVREAVRATITRHDVLRSVFRLPLDGPLEVHRLPPGVVDYASFEGSSAAVLDWIDRECQRRFRVDTELLVRVRHAHEPDADVLAFSVHHLIADLWSCALFTDEVLERYTTGTSLERARPYSVYAREVKRAEENGEPHRRYWRTRLRGVPPCDPVDVLAGLGNRPAIRTYEGSSIRSTLDEATSQLLLDEARAGRVSKQVLMLSIYGIWLASLTGLPDFLTGCLASGRSRAAFARLQGVLTNPFAVRFRIGATTTVADVLASTRDQVLGAIEHEDYPFQAVVRDLNLTPALGRAPLFQNMFVYQQLPASSVLGGCILGDGGAPVIDRGLRIECLRLPTRSSRYDLTLYCAAVESRLSYELVYDSALLGAAQVGGMVTRFDALVRRLLREPSAAPARKLAEEREAVS